MSNKYVPDGCYLTCNKGSAPCRLKVTHHHNTKIYGEFLASEADTIPNENVFPMGRCSATGGSCQPNPLYWDKTIEGVKVNGYKLVIDEAHLICKNGGQVSIQFSVADAMANIAGFGVGALKGAQYLGGKFGPLSEQSSGFYNLANPSRAIKGNFGEIRMTQDLMMRGFQMTSNTQASTLNDPTHQGLDVSAKDPNGPTDVIGDAKFKSSDGPPSMSSTKTGNQMSDKWLTTGGRNSRVYQGMDSEDATRVTGKITSQSDDLTRVAAKVDPQGNVSYYGVDNTGKVGDPMDMPAANVVKGSSKAAGMINDVARSIQGNGAVSAANNWLVENAATVSRVGKVVGRGAIVVGIVCDAISIAGAYQEDGDKIGIHTKEAVGSAAGGLAGAYAGAELGAAIGVIGGPVGILVGGVVGGVIGGIAGSSVGKWIGSWF